MARLEPIQLWWTAEELATSGLPAVPGTKRAINALATRENWRAHSDCARKKAGRGGGWQYHWSLLPQPTKAALLRRVEAAPDARVDRGAAWEAFDKMPQSVRAVATARLKALQDVEALMISGATQVAAVNAVALNEGTSTRTVYNWIKSVQGVDAGDRLAYLAPRHRMVKRAAKGQSAKRFLSYLKSLYMRNEQPTFRACYRIVVKHAEAEGWPVLTARTAERRMNKDVPRVTMVYAREGVNGMMRCYPAQIRDRTGLHAMEGVNADCHKIDVFVQWPDGTINRPQIIAFQDLYSNKILSWRVDHDPNKVMVMSAFGELVETYGKPRRCLFDNGHEFANKWMTGGTKTRFRFKVKEEDPLGVLPLLDIQVHWATPAHGQAKPIERGFGDFARDIAKDPRFAGAYVGNKPTAKPENYGSRAIPAETFLEVLAEGIAEHNARPGRLTPSANGRSFDETFSESYASAQISRATDEERRLWIMGQHVCKMYASTGQISIHGNVYHSDWMSEQPGRKVVARFDPEDLHAGVFIYGVEGEYLGFAECQQKIGFFDLIGARTTAKRNAKIKRIQKSLVKAHAPISIEQIGEDMAARNRENAAELRNKVVSPEFGRRAPIGIRVPPRGYTAPIDPEIEAAREALILQMPAKPTQPDTKAVQATKEGDRFRRAQDILARSDAGQAVGEEEARWVQGYITTAEYLGLLAMFESYGADGVG